MTNQDIIINKITASSVVGNNKVVNIKTEGSEQDVFWLFLNIAKAISCAGKIPMSAIANCLIKYENYYNTETTETQTMRKTHENN